MEPKTKLLTPTVMVTPNISINTWMVVELCAGSIPTNRIASGKVAPKITETNTIRKSEEVMAMDS